MNRNERRPGSLSAPQGVETVIPHAPNYTFNLRSLPVIRQAREAIHAVIFTFVSAHPDPQADALFEFWTLLDRDPPPPSAFAAARRVFSDDFIRQVITRRSELGAEGFDYLRRNLVDACRRAAWGKD